MIPSKEFEKQYKDHLSGFRSWDQRSHASSWLLFPENIGEKMSIDEVAVSNGELYTILTNKYAKGGQGSLAATAAGTKAEDIVPILKQIPETTRLRVKEITLDMSPSMRAMARYAFPNATIVIDRFHVQQLVSEAVQDVRIALRRTALAEENIAILQARDDRTKYRPKVYGNGDTKKQLLARSRHLLFKPRSKWTPSQTTRANVLFDEFPELKKAYNLSMMFRACFEHNHSIHEARDKLAKWYEAVKRSQLDMFSVAAQSIQIHEAYILNYFINRSTNASAESFNAKLKGFRALVRGVRDKDFFLFRVARIYS